MKTYLYFLFLLYLCFDMPVAAKGQMIIATIAGGSSAGSSGDGGPATAALLNTPWEFAFDTVGNLYFTDFYNHSVRKIDTFGTITKFAGVGISGFSGDGGQATAAKFNNPSGIAIDGYGNMFIADDLNERIRKIDVNGIITTIAGTGTLGYSGDGGPATAARINYVNGIAADAAGNVYLADQSNRVRKVDVSGVITTIAGSGVGGYSGDGGAATKAKLNFPNHLSVDNVGNIYLAEYNNAIIRLINNAGIISTFAGKGSSGYSGDGGPATAASMRGPAGVDGTSGDILVCDIDNNCVRSINSAGIITTIAGTTTAGFSGDGGPALSATFRRPHGVIHDKRGNIYITDLGNYRIRKIIVHNRPPVFLGGSSQNITVCQNSLNDSINKQLAVVDSDNWQMETWSLLTLPAHGSVFASGSFHSTGDTVTPKGMSYTPAAGYSGNDSFKVRVSDGQAADTITIYVTVNAAPSPIIGPNHVCQGLMTVLSDMTAGAVWSSSNTSVATVGSGTGVVTGISAGSSVISYSFVGGCATMHTVFVDRMPSAIAGSPNVCAGTITVLVDAGGGTWTSSNTSVASIGYSSGIVSGLSAGTSTITYQLSTGCSVSTMIRVLSSTSPIMGVAVTCKGNTTTLSDTTATGTWTSSNPAIASVGSLSGIVTGVVGGTATITYTASTTGCKAMTIVTVNPLPAAISGVMKVCIGDTTALIDAGGGTWSSSNTVVAAVGASSGVVSGITTGTTTITYSSFMGCEAYATVTVLANPTSITGLTSLCQATATTLSDGTAGGTWISSIPATAIIGSITGRVTAISAGTSTITYQLAAGCFSTTAITVNLSPVAISGAVGVCTGVSTLMANLVTGGRWTSSNTAVAGIDTSTGVLTGLLAGTSTITYVLSTGCAATRIFTVYPLSTVISGTTNLCIGGTSVLSSAPGIGAWSSSNTSIATVTSSGVLTGVSVGSATITYTALATGCMTTTTVLIASSPGAISGVASVCAGASTILSDAAPGGTWSSGNSAVATVGSGTGMVTGVGGGTSIITYSAGGGCKATKIVTVYPVFVISGAGSICTGQTALLSNAISGGAWSSSNTSVASISGAGLVTALLPGTTIISYLSPSGCIATKPLTVNTVPSSIAGVMSVCPGQTTSLTSATTGGTWSSTPAAAVGSLSGFVTGLSTGTANITYSLGSGCVAYGTVTVLALPAPISGPANVCEGASVTFSDATAGGTWSSLSPGIANADVITGSITGVSAGNTAIAYTSTKGCFVSKIITVNAAPAPITGNTNVCAGYTIVLSSASSGGSWAPATGSVAYVGSASGLVFGVSPGTATIVYTLPTGCFTSIPVTVSGLPASIAGPPNVCQGSSAYYSDATTGGVWSSNNTSIATIDAVTGSLTGITSGITNITYALSSGCIATKPVIINPVAPITGITTVCEGATTLLSDVAGGGTWSSSNTLNATIGTSSGSVTGIKAGTTLITYKTPLGCTATTSVLVNALPAAGTISGPKSVCAGSFITLSNTTTGGTWGSVSTTISVDAFIGKVNGLAAGAGIVTYSFSNSCGTATTTYTIMVNPLATTAPVRGDSAVCAGSTITLSDATTRGVWSSTATTISIGSGSGIVTGISKGTATITYTTVNMCSSAKAVYTLTVLPLPIIGPINGAANVCVGSSTTLTDSVAGGIWMCSNPKATVAGGVVAGVAAGLDTVIYITANTCGTNATIHYMTIDPLPDAGVIAVFGAVCVGANDDTLWDAVPGGTWSSADATISLDPATGIVTGINPGVATVTYHVANICGAAIATKNIDVHPQPFAGLITGPASVCAGTTITLSDTIASGAWSTANTLLEVSLDGAVTGIAAGLGTIKYSVTNICGTAVVLHDVTVNPQPQAGAIEGDSIVCTGNEFILADIVEGGAWSSSSSVVSVGTSGVVKGVSTGTATITYTVTNVCGIALAQMGIEVLSVPVVQDIAGASVLCQGMSVSLSDASVDGIWGCSNNILSVSDGVVTGKKSGIDTVMYTLTNMCGSTSAIKEITVNPQPYADAISGYNRGCVGDTVILYSNGMPGVWSNTNNSVANLKQQSDSTVVITSIVSGIDTVVYTVTNSCGTVFAKFPFTVLSETDCPGNKSMPFDCNGNGELMIYPNPNAGKFMINVVSDIQEDVLLVISNMLGQKLSTMKAVTNIALELNLNQPHGVYIISVISAHGQCSKKVILSD